MLREAQSLAAGYHIVLHVEDGDYYGRVIEMPEVMNDGRTPGQCVENTRDMLSTVIAYHMEKREAFPRPDSEDKRTE